MPVLSPRQSSASALTGSYRSTFSSSTLDRPYFGSTSYPRISSYSERFTTRTYSDSDGRRIFSRSGSITEDGLTSHFREESRRDSLSRDSGISSICENSISSYSPHSRRDSTSSSSSRLSAVNLVDTVAELRNKYSPANYVPACMRDRHNDNSGSAISRSNSKAASNDIGLPPIEPKLTLAAAAKKKVNDSLNFNDRVTANSTNDNMGAEEDDNGNRASVADLRKKFETSATPARGKKDLEKQDGAPGVSKAKKKIKTSERLSQPSNLSVKAVEEIPSSNGASAPPTTKLDVNGEKNGAREEEEEARVRGTRVNNFASYIPSADFADGQPINGEAEESGDPIGGRRFGELSTSPKLSTALNSTSSSASSTSSPSRRSADRTYNDTPPSSTTSPVKTQGLNGLKNIGNTCFMNSVIQCLSNTRQLLEYLLDDRYVDDINTTTSGMKGALIKAFVEVIKKLWAQDGAERVVNTTSLKSQIQRFAPRFMGYAQQDAQEFLRYLLEGLHEDVNRVKERPKPILTEIDEKMSDSEKSMESWNRYLRMDNSKIVDCFVGQLKSTLKCTHCGHCSVTFDPFWDLSLPIPQRAVRLSQCLDSFTREETLDGDEKPTCSKCKERRKCTKSFTIQKFPKILVIHLKRFSLAERFRGKLSVTVDFPLEGLDMSQYAADNVAPCRYNLYAVSNHSGTTYSGHYTAYCRHPYTKAWHEYNDSRVSSISPKSIVSGEAYVLFYEQEGQKSHL